MLTVRSPALPCRPFPVRLLAVLPSLTFLLLACNQAGITGSAPGDPCDEVITRADRDTDEDLRRCGAAFLLSTTSGPELVPGP